MALDLTNVTLRDLKEYKKLIDFKAKELREEEAEARKQVYTDLEVYLVLNTKKDSLEKAVKDKVYFSYEEALKACSKAEVALPFRSVLKTITWVPK